MVGNTGGMGGFFGVLWRIGKGFPISEAQPYKPSWSYWLFVEVQRRFRIRDQGRVGQICEKFNALRADGKRFAGVTRHKCLDKVYIGSFFSPKWL